MQQSVYQRFEQEPPNLVKIVQSGGGEVTQRLDSPRGVAVPFLAKIGQ
jgi:hypothetical protein